MEGQLCKENCLGSCHRPDRGREDLRPSLRVWDLKSDFLGSKPLSPHKACGVAGQDLKTVLQDPLQWCLEHDKGCMLVITFKLVIIISSNICHISREGSILRGATPAFMGKHMVIFLL